MLNQETLAVCEVVLNRYLDVLAEHPECVNPMFKAEVADAAVAVARERHYAFMNLVRSVREVPTETDQASLLLQVATTSGMRSDPAAPPFRT